MTWTDVATHTDKNTGIIVVKQIRKRKGRSETRYLVRVVAGTYIYLRRQQLFNMTDAVDDVCDLIEEGKF